MKLGLLGGSFDPVHAGHVAAARQARETLGLERVLLLPTADPPHKPPRAASPWRRFAMVELAVLDEEGLLTSAHELTPGVTAYTVDTLEHFRDQRPEDELHLVLGSDSLARIHTWRRWRDLFRLARIAVLARPGWALEEVRGELPEEVVARLEPAGAPLRDGLPEPVVVGHTLEVSATRIREALARGERPGADQLHPRVLDYVDKYGLYR